MRFLFLALLLGLACCGPSARQVEINTTLKGLNVASDAFVIYSHEHTEQIIKACDPKVTTEDECKANVASYRAKEAKVVALLSAAYNSLAAAITINDKHTLAAALSAVVLAKTAYDDLKKGTQ